MAYKWVFFDIGYTLFNEDKPTLKRLCDQSLLNQLDGYKKVTGQEMMNSFYDYYGNYNCKYQNIMADFGFTEFAPYDSNLEELYPSSIKVLESLKGKYKLGVIANQPKFLKERMQERGILDYFDIILSSYDCGYKKPDENIFKMAIEMSGCKPEELVMVGDRIDNDIYPAKKLGFTTIRVQQGTAKMQKPRSMEEIPDFDLNDIWEIISKGIL